jgi:hypothetical protein
MNLFFKHTKLFFAVLFTVCSFYENSFSQFTTSHKIELTGVVMTADSLRYLPFANVTVPKKDIGTYTSGKGVFSIIVEKGDVVQFSYQGFRKKYFKVPDTLSNLRYSVIQLLTQDTFYLPETIIRPALSANEFDKAFRTWDIPDDKYEVIRKNTEMQTLRTMALTLPRDGRESQHVYQNLLAQSNYWSGQAVPPQRLFSPLAWADFFKAWKRGDYKRKK